MRCLALTLVALMGCAVESTEQDYSPTPDPSLEVRHERLTILPTAMGHAEEVIAAAHAWEAATSASCPIVFDIVIGDTPVALSVGFDSTGLEPEWLGVTRGSTVQMRDQQWGASDGMKRLLRTTLRHEIGHALGLGHRSDGVMQPSSESPITENDVIEYCKLR